ncbi:hypothetical protein CHI02_23945, partial [Niallia circulans]|uniref:hypothetical protein n=1 Tax=Niallia circulans TaxID=1397 RepID=UPI000BCA9959
MADKNETSRGIIKQIEVDGVKWNVLTETENGCYCVSQNGYVEKFIPNKPKNNITVKVDVDISEALTGLKSLQRE